MFFAERCLSISKLLFEMQSAAMVRCRPHSGEFPRSEKASLIKKSLLSLTFEYGCLLTSPCYHEKGVEIFYDHKGESIENPFYHTEMGRQPQRGLCAKVIPYVEPRDQQRLKFLIKKVLYTSEPGKKYTTSV